MSGPIGDPDTDQLTLCLPTEVCLPEAGSIVEVSSLDGRQVCLARLDDGELTAFEPRCPHRGARLCHGVLEDGQVICLEHLWRWQTCGGQPANPGHPRLRTYRVDQRGALLTLRLQ